MRGSTAPPAEYAADLFWLLHQGHILLFTDDTLVVQNAREGHTAEPGSEPKKKKKKKKSKKPKSEGDAVEGAAAVAVTAGGDSPVQDPPSVTAAPIETHPEASETVATEAATAEPSVLTDTPHRWARSAL